MGVQRLDMGVTDSGEVPIVRPRSVRPEPGGLAPQPNRPSWQGRYVAKVVVSDVLAVVGATALYGMIGDASVAMIAQVGALILGLVICCLAICRAWEPTVLGQGSVEFSRLLRAIVGAGVVVGLGSLALELPEGRPWTFGVLPVAGVLAALSRRLLRIGLHRRRRAGDAMREMLAVGTEDRVAALIGHTRQNPHNGLTITGVCTPAGTGSVEGIPIVGDLDSARGLAASGRYDVVSVSQAPGWSSRRLQRLAWHIEGRGTELIVDPGLLEVAGPRLHVAAVDGLPLLRLTQPRFSGTAQLLKSAFDRTCAVLILVVFAPLLVAMALAVLVDGGPVFFRQTRVGLDGREFTMFKFRSMVTDAEAQLGELQLRNEGAGPLFKMRRDPRVTRVGAFMRRYSLDELPQLLNVLGGSMSLVGPRPPLPVEVAGYVRDVRRRLWVKPGMTGLWQVSGRSDLSWDESIRLDLRYVENWTLVLDAQILLKTIRAVIRGDGAY